MVIKQIFNNNVVLAKNSSKDELVAMGCGIAFKKKVGDKINENSIEKTFILKQKDASSARCGGRCSGGAEVATGEGKRERSRTSSPRKLP